MKRTALWENPAWVLLLLGLSALSAIVPARVAAETLTVTDAGNEGPGTLRDLVERAAPNDTIVVPVGMTVLLQREIVITKDLTIVGSATISGGDVTRIFSIRGARVNLSSLTLTDGNAANGDPANPTGGRFTSPPMLASCWGTKSGG